MIKFLFGVFKKKRPNVLIKSFVKVDNKTREETCEEEMYKFLSKDEDYIGVEVK